ncbi:MAG: hypothetical protein NC489_27405 [Ruminococcus flavefaciens]|nr:hypothetical protein [Ruminococcus flavefaciens]
MIDESYIPAVITAGAGIVGIFINLMMEMHYKNLDKRVKVKEKMQMSIEEYYLPLAMKISEFNCKVKASGLDLERILEILCNSKTPSAKDEKMVENLRDCILDMYEFISNTNFKYVDDILLHKYFIEVREVIENLHNTISCKKDIMSENINFQYFNLYVNRAYDRLFYYNSGCFLKYWYYKENGKI